MSAVSKNIYLNDTVSKIIHHGQNSAVQDITDRFSEVDSVMNFGEFREAISALKRSFISKGKGLGYNMPGSESLFYGHLQTLANYARVPCGDIQRLGLPVVEHGITWLQRVPPGIQLPYTHSYVSQGGYRMEAIRKFRPWMPQYKVGPYIAYASHYYSDDALFEIKQKIGKTVLVFPAHTYEQAEATYEKSRFVDTVVESYSGDYDTILVSAYWHDADDEIFSLFEEAGAKVVSAGVRTDPLFLSRLKSIIYLSDCIVGNTLGTNIGYSVYLNKSFVMTAALNTLADDRGNAFANRELAALDEVTEMFGKAFCELSNQGETQNERESLYRCYWGGDDEIKTPEEVRHIFEIGHDILQESKGFSSRYAESVKRLLATYKRESESASVSKCKLLSEALGVENPTC